MVTISSGSLSSGASIATGYTQPTGVTVTRADIAGPSTMYKLKTVENSGTPARSHLFPLDLGRHYMTIAISTATRQTSLGGGTKFGAMNINTKDYIRLPLPENIKDINEVSYTEEGVVSLSSTAGALMGTFSPNSLVTQSFNLFGKQGVGAELKARSGTAPNQMLTILLKGPKYKSHSFSWKLYPRDAKESGIIKNIIQTLKNTSRPGLSQAGWFFTFPHIFKLSFTTGGIKNDERGAGYLFEFKPAVLQSIVVNYTPSGHPSLYKGTAAPDGVELTLNFQELEYWLGEDRPSEWDLVGDTLQTFNFFDVGSVSPVRDRTG